MTLTFIIDIHFMIRIYRQMKVKASLNFSHEENYYFFLNVSNAYMCKHINIYIESYQLVSK